MNRQKFEIIPIERGELGLEVNSRLLHEKLKVGRQYSKWITEKISRYGFEKGVDFYPFLAKSTGGRRSNYYIVTLDVAKELAMVEENETGRMIRRYFIEIEKQYRDWIGFVMPRLEVDFDLFGAREGYDYIQLLRSVGCSTHKNAVRSRISKHRNEFWKSINNAWFVSKDYGKTIILYAIARRWSAKKLEIQK